MDVWEAYGTRLNAHGITKRDAAYKREVRLLNNKLKDNLSSQEVTFYPYQYCYNIDTDQQKGNSYKQQVAIINSDNLNQKYLYSYPEQDIQLGSLMYWMDNYWIVQERNANTTVYTKAKLIQCNHLLKWINDEHKIIEQWCVVQDGTKYLTGQYQDRQFVVTRGDSRISIQVPRNSETVKLNRESRFLVDDPDSNQKLSYLLTKPLKRGLTYNNQGVLKFVLQEVTATKYDNMKLGIADYYKYFPIDGDADPDLSGNSDNSKSNTSDKKSQTGSHTTSGDTEKSSGDNITDPSSKDSPSSSTVDTSSSTKKRKWL